MPLNSVEGEVALSVCVNLTSREWSWADRWRFLFFLLFF